MSAQTKAVLPKTLPKPDEHGNYWLGEKTQCPAIFKSGRTKEDSPTRYFASVGDVQEEFGLLTDEAGIAYFDTPVEALKALRKRVSPLRLSFRGGL